VDGEESGDGRDGQDVDGQPVPCADVELLRRSDPAGPVDLVDVGRGRGDVHADEERDPAGRCRGRLSAHPSGRCGAVLHEMQEGNNQRAARSRSRRRT
jgi:hypothetical protein